MEAGMKTYQRMLNQDRAEGKIPARLPIVTGKVVKAKPGKGNAKVKTFTAHLAEIKARIAKAGNQETIEQIKKELIQLQAEQQLIAFGR